jgi:hypothetical protein
MSKSEQIKESSSRALRYVCPKLRNTPPMVTAFCYDGALGEKVVGDCKAGADHGELK